MKETTLERNPASLRWTLKMTLLCFCPGKFCSAALALGANDTPSTSTIMSTPCIWKSVIRETKKAFHVYFSFNKKIPWIIFQPRFCTCTWVATRSLVRKVSRKLLDGISCAEDEDGRIWEWEVHLELQRVYTCHWGGELHLVTSGPWPSSHRAALKNSKAMSSRPLQTTPQRLLRIQLIPWSNRCQRH